MTVSLISLTHTVNLANNGKENLESLKGKNFLHLITLLMHSHKVQLSIFNTLCIPAINYFSQKFEEVVSI